MGDDVRLCYMMMRQTQASPPGGSVCEAKNAYQRKKLPGRKCNR